MLTQSSAAEGVLQDVEAAFPVGIAVGVALPGFVPGKPQRRGSVQAIGKPVAGRLATGCIAGPAAGVHTLLAGSVGVDGDLADILFTQLPAPSVYALCARLE